MKSVSDRAGSGPVAYACAPRQARRSALSDSGTSPVIEIGDIGFSGRVNFGAGE